MIDKIQATRKYLDYLQNHYNNVQIAWLKMKDAFYEKDFLNANIIRSIESDVLLHDASKLSHEEFVPYREKFYRTIGDDPVKNEIEFEWAWKHHLEHNNHHWQRVRLISERNGYIIPTVHMVVDWIAMSYELGGDARSYFENEKEKMLLPSHVYDLVLKILDFF